MIQKYLPDNKLLNGTSYAELCDFSFMRQDGIGNIPESNIEEIVDGSTVYCWLSKLNYLFQYINHKNLKNITLISGDNDHSTNPNGWITGWPQYSDFNGLNLLFSPPNIKLWLSQNAEIENNIMKPLPIGVTKEYRTKSERINIETYKNSFGDYNRRKLLYSNFSIGNNRVQRKILFDVLSFSFNDQNSTTHKETITQDEYFKNLQEHIFVACPPGNGKDTHRTWESLYFGAIPIVEDSVMNRYFAKLFPMLVVESWFHVTPNYLKNKYEEMSQKNWRYDLLDAKNYFSYHGVKTK